MGWGDCNLMGYSWHNDGKDLWLDVIHGSGQRGFVRCSWVGGFEINIHYDSKRSGPTLSRGAEFTRSDGRWAVVWDFASEGTLRYTCQDIVYASQDA